MRIIHVVPTVSIGGVRRHIEYLSILGRSTGKITVVSIFQNPRENDVPLPNCDHIFLNISVSEVDNRHKIIDLLGDIYRKLCPDIVHSHHYYADIYAIPAANKFQNIGTVHTIHGISQISKKDNFQKTFIRFNWSQDEIVELNKIIEVSDASICVSQDIYNKLRNHGILERHLSVIRNGVDAKIFSKPSQRDLRLVGDNKNSASKTLVIGFMGRLEPVKNAGAMIEIYCHLVRRNIYPSFIIVGSGKEEQKIRYQVQAKRLDRFFQFWSETDEVSSFYSVIDILIVPSYTEGCPYTVLEAMALGIPVIASRVGGIPELITDRQDGILFDNADLAAVADYVEILSDVTTRQMYSQQAKRKILKKFTAQTSVKQTEDIYDNIIIGRKNG